mmetsp:Transcript_38252/g.88237  ORF Transcript_38252/g.88237 Transcript_38252/m.88237 type:complete len:278 (+) Transcript_38252:276-1109(+)
MDMNMSIDRQVHVNIGRCKNRRGRKSAKGQRAQARLRRLDARRVYAVSTSLSRISFRMRSNSSSSSRKKRPGSTSATGSALKPILMKPLYEVTVTPRPSLPGNGTKPMIPRTLEPRKEASVGEPITFEKMRLALAEYINCSRLQSWLPSSLVVNRMNSMATGTAGLSFMMSIRYLQRLSRRWRDFVPIGRLTNSAPTRLLRWYRSFFPRTLTGMMHLSARRGRFPVVSSRYLCSAPAMIAQHVSLTVPRIECPMFATSSYDMSFDHAHTRFLCASFI